MTDASGLQNGRKIGRAWLALCAALAVHVSDEALTGFLDVYNPTVSAIRGRLPWLPLPVFRFEEWITGLVAAIVAMVFLSVFVFRGARWTRPAAYAFALIMLVNAIGHTAGTLFGRTVASVRFAGPMPGFYSSPLLLAASVYLLLQLRSTSARTFANRV
jgi:hypothetical protein